TGALGAIRRVVVVERDYGVAIRRIRHPRLSRLSLDQVHWRLTTTRTQVDPERGGIDGERQGLSSVSALQLTLLPGARLEDSAAFVDARRGAIPHRQLDGPVVEN